MFDHVRMVPIVISLFPCISVHSVNILPPEENAVGDQSTDLENNLVWDKTFESSIGPGTYGSIRHEHSIRKSPGQPRQTILSQSCLVKHSTSEDISDRVFGAVVCEKSRRHEWQRPGIPDVVVVHAEHGSKANK